MTAPLTGRASGVLLHITSLPSPWGVGDLGARARELAGRLGAARQRYWQVLPLNPTSAAAGESPYFSPSSRAGNPLLISLEDLAKDGLLTTAELAAPAAPDTGHADFARARTLKLPLLARAADRLTATGDDDGYRAFCRREADWLEDHALFTALKTQDPRAWSEWPAPLGFRHGAAPAEAHAALGSAIAREKRVQYLFHRQWQRLHDCCRTAGVWLFGDMPIYVNLDSVDVWARPDVFQLDAALKPVAESGVPPDYFSATGQLWRNPVYDWDRLAAEDFRWWVLRLGTLLGRVDVLRIDHFRGLAQYWRVPAGAETAAAGEWRDVPSYQLLDRLRSAFDPLPVVAEDLGTITPDVHILRDHYRLPGMVVLQFAFNEDNDAHPYLPQNHPENCVAYLGTHDNNTARGWLESELDEPARERLARFVALDEDAAVTVARLLNLLMASPARTVIVSAQDLLALPASARMNTPGQPTGNWDWQLTGEQFEALSLERLGELAAAHGRG
ncbi:4-alpha-glucanotransferase [Pseudohaliea rubra]|uniref:4-alpha-glucanotransferase n=1 Tax=Pseudohaliea rubra DSM 19751 TaxID=1265313 RepID=A0A095XSI8_9GAMM|nr:4-alpha-glucanotransferase [Pseudohaliea rubra]KGE02616.1 4-alpha-glucanotransferase (amylomaltase) [Pseudohaliea rubra DSM 19751]